MRTSYKSTATADRKIVCDGNSITAGAGGTPYPSQLSDLLRIATVTNVGVSGKTTAQLTSDFTTKVVPYYVPGAELIWFEQYNSFNPLNGNGNNSVATEKTLVQAYVAQAQSAGFKFWICTPPPTSDTDINDKITEYSTWLRSNYSSFVNGGLIDLNAVSVFTPPGNVANPTYFFDSVHLTSKGYAALAATVFAAITG